MQTFEYFVLFFSFFFAIASALGSVAVWVQNLHLSKQWIYRVGELENLFVEVNEHQDKLKLTLEQLHKLHLQRQEDLKPLLDRLAVLETRLTAVSANQRRPA